MVLGFVGVFKRVIMLDFDDVDIFCKVVVFIIVVLVVLCVFKCVWYLLYMDI